MSNLIDPFVRNEFLLRSLIAGILVSIACAIVGTYVVLRGLAFIGDALAHGVIPGIAVALLFGIPGVIGAAVGARERERALQDAAERLRFADLDAAG